MQFVEFQNRLSAYSVFSLRDIRKAVPDFNRIQLDRWEKKGYARKIRQGFYCFANRDVNQNFLFHAANKVYTPSYVSLEAAMKYYGLIPEEIFQITSVSAKKATGFQTPIGNFNYRHIKPDLYWGYRLMDLDGQKFLMAEPEKAVLDYIYVNPRLKTAHDFEGMRINVDEWKEQINLEKFQKYMKNFGNKRLTKCANTFLKTMQHDNT